MQPDPFAAYGRERGRVLLQPVSPEQTIADFIAAMEASGLEPAEPIAIRLGGGALVRFRCKGDRAGKANAWAILHLDDGRPAGAFGSWKHGISEKWHAEGFEPLSAAERRARANRYREEQERRETERRAIQLEVAMRCRAAWVRFGPASPSHAYLIAKGISGEGARQAGSWLRVPMYDADGLIWNIQRIAPDGLKLAVAGRSCLATAWSSLPATVSFTIFPLPVKEWEQAESSCCQSFRPLRSSICGHKVVSPPTHYWSRCGLAKAKSRR